MIRSFILVLMLLVFAAGAGAQSYPVKPIRLIVPYTPGGDTDIVARHIAPKLSESLRQQVIVDNRPGAGSLIGTEAMLRAPADGYTLAMGTISSLAVLPVTRSNVPYDPVKDIAPIILVTVGRCALLSWPQGSISAPGRQKISSASCRAKSTNGKKSRRSQTCAWTDKILHHGARK